MKHKKQPKKYIAIGYQAKMNNKIVNLLAWDSCQSCRGTGERRTYRKNTPSQGCDCVVYTELPVSFIIRESK